MKLLLLLNNLGLLFLLTRWHSFQIFKLWREAFSRGGFLGLGSNGLGEMRGGRRAPKWVS